jgi:hypothetical protein
VYLDPLTGEWTDPRTGGPAWGPFQPRLQLPNGQWIDPAEGFLAAGGPLTPQQYAQWLRMIRPQPGDPGYVEPGLRPDYGTMIAIGSLGAGYLAAGRGLVASSQAPQGYTRAYRAVSEAEYQNILRTGRFNPHPNSLEGRWFADTLEGARAHGRALYPNGNFRIIQADVPNNAPSLFRLPNLDGRGPARYLDLNDLRNTCPRPVR